MSTLNHAIIQEIEKRVQSAVAPAVSSSIDFLSANIERLSERIGMDEDLFRRLQGHVPIRLVKNAAFELVEEGTGIPEMWWTGGSIDNRFIMMDETEYVYGSKSPKLYVDFNTTDGDTFLAQDVVVGGSKNYSLSFYYNLNSSEIKPFAWVIGRDGDDIVTYDETFHLDSARTGYWRRVQLDLLGVGEETETLELRLGFAVDKTGLTNVAMWVDGVALEPGLTQPVFDELQAGIITSEFIQSDEILARHIRAHQIETEHISTVGLDASVITTGELNTELLNITGIMTAINQDGSTTTITGGKIHVQAPGGSSINLTEFFTADNNETKIAGGQIATGSISTAQLSVNAFGDSDGINLVLNSGFVRDENNDGIPDHWLDETLLGAIDRSIDHTEYMFDFRTLKMSAEMISTGGVASERIEVFSDTVYTISGYMKVNSNQGAATLKVAFVYEDDSEKIVDIATHSGGDWRRYHAIISTDTDLDTNKKVTHVRVLCYVENFVGEAWFDGIQLEKGSLLTGYMPREVTDTQIGPGIIRTHHISAYDFEASVITGGEFVITDSLTLRTVDDRIKLNDTGITIIGGALRFSTSSSDDSERLVMDEDGIKGFDENNSVGFHLKTDGTAEFLNSVTVTAGNVTIDREGITVSSGNRAIRVLDGGYIFVGDSSETKGVRIDGAGLNADDVLRVGRLMGGNHGLSLATGVMSLVMDNLGFIIKRSTEDIFAVTPQGDLTIRGTVYAVDGEFSGTVKSNSGYFGSVSNGVSIGDFGLTVVGTGSIVAGNVKIKSKTIEVESEDTPLILGEYATGKLGLKFGDTVFDSKDGIYITGRARITLGDNGEFSVDTDGSMVAKNAEIDGTITVTGASTFRSTVTIANGGSIVADMVTINPDHIRVDNSGGIEQLRFGKFTVGSEVRYGMRAGDAIIDSGGITISGSSSSITLGPNKEFKVSSSGHLEAISALFGNAINVDASGVYHGSGLRAADSNFGIGADGSGYFKGVVEVHQNSVVHGDMSVGPTGRIFAGIADGQRFEITSTGAFLFDSNNDEIFAIDNRGSGSVRIKADQININSGRINDTLYVGSAGEDVRIGEGKKPVINLYHPTTPGKVIRLAAYDDLFGLYYSLNGSDFFPAITGDGITANAITDGSIFITDTQGGAGANGLYVRRRETDRPVRFPAELPFGFVDLGHKSVEVLEVWNTSKTTKYSEDTDYIVNKIDGTIARRSGSRIPQGGQVLVTYDWDMIGVTSDSGIRIQDGFLEVYNQHGTTLIGGGFVHVDGLDVGVQQSDNFVQNGNFTHTSNQWGTKQTNDGKSLPGYPEYPAGGPFFGDWYTDRAGNTYRHGASFWIPSKSDVTFDGQGNMTGYTQVAFAPTDFLHNIYGYANIMVAGSTHQWGEIEHDVYPWFNYTNGDFIIPTEQFEDVVVSAGFHWHAAHTQQNTITMEVDELVPNWVFVNPQQTKPFTPVWDNVHEEYQGLDYAGNWSFDDESWLEHAQGENLAYMATVRSNGTIDQSTLHYAVDGMFIRDHEATKTTNSGYHYLEIELAEEPIDINQIHVWHSTQGNRKYRDYKLEVSADGQVWEVIYDTTRAVDPDPEYNEGIDGKKHVFPTKKVRFIRDWINGYEITSGPGEGTVVNENQWVEIIARHTAVAVTNEPGSYVEWEFTPHSRADLWIGFVQGTQFGKGRVEIDGVQVAVMDQSAMITDQTHGDFHVQHSGGDDHVGLYYVDVSSQEWFNIIPRKKHKVRVIFDDIPENYGKSFNITRIKLEDFRAEGEQYTTREIIASANIRPANPYGFYYPSIVPNKARNYTGYGRQILRGLYDNPRNYSPSGNCWLRYRIRIRSERAEGGDIHGHDHVMISHVMMEKGTKATSYRRSSLDITPSHFLQQWVDDEYLRDVTGVHTGHIADGAITGRKIAEKAIENRHLSSDLLIDESNLNLVSYARVDGNANLSGTHVFTAKENAIRITPSVTNPDELELRIVGEQVKLNGYEATQLIHSPVNSESEVVTSMDGTKTYVRGDDYVINYWNGLIARVEGSSIPDGATVKVSYTRVNKMLTITDPSGVEDRFGIDSHGNIFGKSITVTLSATERESGGVEAPGDFVIRGNLEVENSSTLGSNSNTDSVDIYGPIRVRQGTIGSSTIFVNINPNNGSMVVNGNLQISNGTLTVNGTSVSLEGHNHNDLYPTKTQLATNEGASIHAGNITTGQIRASVLPDATSSNKGAVTLAQSGSTRGYSASVARADHSHAGLESVLGPGVYSGFEVLANSPPNQSVRVTRGRAILEDGYVFDGESYIDVGLHTDGQHSRYVIVFISGKRESQFADQFGIKAGPADGSLSLPALDGDEIPLALILLNANDSTVTSSQITDIRKFTDIRWGSDGHLYGYGEYDVSQRKPREAVWRLEKGGRVTFFGDDAGISTDGGVTHVDVSGKSSYWDNAATHTHEHIFNDIPTKVNDGTDKTYKLKYHVRVLDGRTSLMLYKNGLYMTPGVDYTVTNDTISFTERIHGDDVLVANYVRVPSS